ncbi:hypothetical protein IPH70_03910 [Candidatus Roizmanbacteria bacterium]|nr:MAG: hypothetical protein IPH70_03910 [Candidatus Roizmanbacteria bacterium]
MKNFTVISDPGIDDLVALVLLYKLRSESKNCLVSSFGNAAETITARNAKEFISYVANDWQFVHGSALPLSGIVETLARLLPWSRRRMGSSSNR